MFFKGLRGVREVPLTETGQPTSLGSVGHPGSCSPCRPAYHGGFIGRIISLDRSRFTTVSHPKYGFLKAVFPSAKEVLGPRDDSCDPAMKVCSLRSLPVVSVACNASSVTSRTKRLGP